MVMYFQLLNGQHEDENGVRYQTEVVRNDKGEVVETVQPVIKSKVDLVKCFGPEKFRRLNEEQANLILLPEKKTPGIEQKQDDPVPGASGKLIGTNVTRHYPEAKEANLLVFVKDGNYRVVNREDGKELTLTGSLKKEEVKPFIKNYLEG